MKTYFLSLLILLAALGTQAKMFGNKFQQGYYYDINRQKVEGLINMNPSGKGPVNGEGFIAFKEDDKAEKQNLSASMIHGFVVGRDSFVVARAPKNGPWSSYELDFIRVVVDAPTKLYEITDSGGGGGSRNGGGGPRISTGIGLGGGLGGFAGIGLSLGGNLFGGGKKGGGGGSGGIVYYYGAGPNSLALLTRQNFIDVMSELLADEPEAVEKVKNKTYKIDDMDKLVDYYDQLREKHLKN